MNPDGSGQTRITDDTHSDGEPAWSPDGRKIAFVSDRDGGVGPNQLAGEIYTMNADGSAQTRLTNNPALDFAPAWSPDGTKIAFTTDRDGSYQIYTMNADGSQQTRVTQDPTDSTKPDWQPIPGPQRSDYKNAAQFCKAEHDFLGEGGFGKKYGTNGNGANAYGKCVSGN